MVLKMHTQEGEQCMLIARLDLIITGWQRRYTNLYSNEGNRGGTSLQQRFQRYEKWIGIIRVHIKIERLGDKLSFDVKVNYIWRWTARGVSNPSKDNRIGSVERGELVYACVCRDYTVIVRWSAVRLCKIGVGGRRSIKKDRGWSD